MVNLAHNLRSKLLLFRFPSLLLFKSSNSTDGSLLPSLCTSIINIVLILQGRKHGAGDWSKSYNSQSRNCWWNELPGLWPIKAASILQKLGIVKTKKTSWTVLAPCSSQSTILILSLTICCRESWFFLVVLENLHNKKIRRFLLVLVQVGLPQDVTEIVEMSLRKPDVSRCSIASTVGQNEIAPCWTAWCFTGLQTVRPLLMSSPSWFLIKCMNCGCDEPSIAETSLLML
jgi:hypothetical protein